MYLASAFHSPFLLFMNYEMHGIQLISRRNNYVSQSDHRNLQKASSATVRSYDILEDISQVWEVRT